jgi:hydrogenase expression/formation protein HypC
MCLGVPGKIIEIYEADGMHMGKVDFGGASREVCLAYVPQACVGDYAIIHVGFALNLISEQEALETLGLLSQMAGFSKETGQVNQGIHDEVPD